MQKVGLVVCVVLALFVVNKVKKLVGKLIVLGLLLLLIPFLMSLK